MPKPVVDRLVREYQVCARDNPKMAVATVAIKTLTTLISQSQATTMMGLEKEIKEAAAALQRCAYVCRADHALCHLGLRDAACRLQDQSSQSACEIEHL